MIYCMKGGGITEVGHCTAVLAEYYRWTPVFRKFMFNFLSTVFCGELDGDDRCTVFRLVASMIEWFGCEARDYFDRRYDVGRGYDPAYVSAIVTTLMELHFPEEYQSYLNGVTWMQRGGYHE